MNLRPLFVIFALVLAVASGASAATYAEAYAAKQAGDHVRAIELFNQLAVAEPHNTDVLFQLGTVQGWAGRYDDALATFERGLALAPRHTDLRLGYGRVLAWSGKFGRAEAVFRAVLADEPGNLDALNMLGRVLTWQRQLDAAGEVFTNILASAPSNPDALVGQGDVERAQERFTEARALYERAHAIEPDSADIARRLASVQGAGRWRLDAGFEHSDFAGNARDDWQGWNAALRYTLDRRTGLAGGSDHARRFGHTDTQYWLGGDRRFGDRLAAYARLHFTPGADFFARRSLAAGGTWRAREADEHWGATFLLADYRSSDFGIGTAHSLWVGVTQATGRRVAVTGKVLVTRNLNDNWTSGWQLRLDGEPSDQWRWHLGYADTEESLTSTIFDFTREWRTRAVFAGAAREFSSTLGLRLDLTHEWSEGAPDRNGVSLGVVTRF